MITILSGNNHFLIQHKFKELKFKFIEKYGESAVESYKAEQLDVQKLQALLLGVSLFAENRLVIIKYLSSDKDLSETFLDISKQIPDTTSVILLEGPLDKRTGFYKTLKKDFSLLEYTELSDFELLKWISDTVHQQGGKIAPKEVKLLLQMVGNDQIRLLNEIQKLVLYNSEITHETIMLLVEKKPEDLVFQLLESSLGGKQSQALTILEELQKSHEDPFAVANMLIWQTYIVAVVDSAGSTPEFEIAKQAKIKPYVVQKTKRLISQLSRQSIKLIIDNVASMDIKLKSNNGSPWSILEQTILELGGNQ